MAAHPPPGRPLIELIRAATPPGERFDELVKGSYDYAMAAVRSAFYRQFRSAYADNDGLYLWVEEVFDAYLIVKEERQPPDEFYLVAYTRDVGGAFTFEARDRWQVVELTYRIAATTSESNRAAMAAVIAADRGAAPALESAPAPAPARRRVELTESLVHVRLGDATANGARRIVGYGVTADTVNGNNRIYERPILEAALNEARQRMQTLGGRAVLGEAEHPGDKPTPRANFLETVVRWDVLEIEPDGRTRVEGALIPTSKGMDAITLMEHGVLPGLSQRAWGYAEMATINGRTVERITELHIEGYDLVLEPADPNGAVTMLESRRPGASAQQPTKKETTVEELTLDQLRAKYPELVAQALAEADAVRREAEIAKLQERAKLDTIRDEARQQALDEARQQHAAELAAVQAEKRRLEEAEQRRQVNDHIAAAIGGLDAYNGATKQQLIADVQGDSPATIADADALIARRRKTIDAALAQAALAGRGRIEAVAPVIEVATGHPAYAATALHLSEALRRYSLVEARPHLMQAPRTRAEALTANLLRMFDAQHRHELQAEARRWEEAETTADLNLPYTVARTIVAEATPMLVAASIFDVQPTDAAPTRIYYEYYAEESGSAPSVTDEVVTASLGAWVNLANRGVLRFGSVVVTNSGGTTTYVEGTDYVIDYIEGRFRALAGGAITASQSLRVDYTYDAIKRGENAAIKRGKQTLQHKTLEIAATRLAGQISREAVVFSRSQLGYDATTRMLAGVVRRISEAIDKGILLRGLAASLSVASNSGGSWNASSGTLPDLVKFIGVAKTKVANRHYAPDFVLMSKTNSDRLSNSDLFTASGARADAVLNEAGGVGLVKGLPVFDSTQFPDGWLLIGNRELVAHRIFQALVLRGPLPTFDSNGEVIAADQYYAEQFDGTDSHVPEKGAHVTIV